MVMDTDTTPFLIGDKKIECIDSFEYLGPMLIKAINDTGAIQIDNNVIERISLRPIKLYKR
jgi:hypothetical protein